MRLFRLKNTGKWGWWVFADTVEQAVEISFNARRARCIENITVVGDQTEHFRDTTDLNSQITKGIASLLMPSRRWIVRPAFYRG